MSAIDVHIGTQSEEDRKDASCALRPGFGSARACIPELSATHNGQTRMVWIRRSLEELLADRKYFIADGASIGKKGTDAAELYLVIDRPFTKNEIPWMPAAVESIDAFALVGEAGKMQCGTWDLPAGSPVIGGACPGATAGQSTIPLQIRSKAAPAVGEPVRLQETICQICYAEGGQYASPHVQAGEILRYWWCREAMATPAGTAEWIDTVVRALQGITYRVERLNDPRTGRPVMPVRLHSSGDFFSHAYARAWIEVANRLPEIMFWGPTRTWAAPGWNEAWRAMLPALKHGNLALRPSAYHTDDPAPAPDAHPWDGGYPYTSAGTSAIYKFNDKGEGRDPRYDFTCRAYAVVDEAKTCRNATAPDGEIGCRACWIRPDLRINYTAH